MQATLTTTESPAIPAPRELEVGDSVLRTITMANMPLRIWIWRADIADPTYPYSKRTFLVRMHDDRIPEGASAHEDHFVARCVHGRLRHCLTYPC